MSESEPGWDALDPEDPLFSAVREEVLRYGVRRATLSSIARRAGVSRMTVYRRVGGIGQLILDALVAEFTATIARAGATATGGTARAALVAQILGAIDALAEAPLTVALREHDPELLLPYLVDRHGTNQRHILTILAGGIRAGQADGSIRVGDPDLMALVLLHATQDFVISSRILADSGDPHRVREELALLLDRYLTP
ncbi:MAG: TetR family transcriptional regulator [Tetrasphaera sp.]|jgi:AcrR family transcriptional regulator|nr:TetR family transcriptional regulator [Tetrasphaera sp.]